MRKLLFLYLLSNGVNCIAIAVFNHHTLSQLTHYESYAVTYHFWMVVMAFISIFALLVIKFFNHKAWRYGLLFLYPFVLTEVLFSIVYDLRAELGGTWTSQEMLLGWVLYDKFVLSIIILAALSQMLLFKLFGGKDAKI